jgi:hypothetical protein
MLNKWYIGVSAKSKGFFTGWQYHYNSWWFRMDIIDDATIKKETSPRPSFTKQSALATSYDTKKEAKESVATYRKDAVTMLNKPLAMIKQLEELDKGWTQLSDKERVTVWDKLDHSIASIVNDRKHINSNSNKKWTGKGYKFTKAGHKALKDIVWCDYKKYSQYTATMWQNRIDFIDSKLQVREEALEFKFKDSERRKVRWEIRGDNDTSYNYCNLCGGAIPSIPQLRLGWGKYNHSGGIIICAICMGKLAEEAKIQAGKVPDEIMEQYQQDRFLRDLG